MPIDYQQKLEVFAQLFELSTDAIMVWAPGHSILLWNRGAEQLYGYSEEEALAFRGTRLLEPVFPTPAQDVYSTLASVGHWDGIVHEVTKAGRKIAVSARYQSMILDGKQVVLAINRDVTAQQQMQCELESLNTELIASNRELDEFAYIATHDLKEPFRGIAINADILLRENLPEKVQVRVRRMGVLCQRIDHLLADLLYFSRLGNLGSTQESIDPRDVIARVEDELRETLVKKSFVLTVEKPLPCVFAELGKIRTVFFNLIQNALLYNDSEQCLIDIGFLPELTLDGVMMQRAFYVRDNGIGIASGNHARIFQFFKRLNREEDYGFGTGAGLSFVKKIVESHDGKILLSSFPGEGSTFYFSLPLDRSSDKQNNNKKIPT
ncbi:MAG: ATP-binding protein [Granulosicoccus sp.]